MNYHRTSNRLGACLVSFAMFAVPTLFAPFANGADGGSVDLSYSLIDDGSCEDALETMRLGYRYESETRSVYGNIDQGPSGGDCRVKRNNYTIDAQQNFPFAMGFDGMVKIGADERSVAAAYGIVDGEGNLLTRPDGGPASPVMLPSGRAFTLTGVFGACREFGSVETCIGRNIAGTDWHDGTNSGSWHVGLNSTFDFLGGEIDAALSYDTGNFDYGDARVAWRRQLADSDLSLFFATTYAWGLTNLDAGVPGMQTFSGLPAMLLPGSAQSNATTYSMGLSIPISL